MDHIVNIPAFLELLILKGRGPPFLSLTTPPSPDRKSLQCVWGWGRGGLQTKQGLGNTSEPAGSQMVVISKYIQIRFCLVTSSAGGLIPR